jgi:cation diffusion facilitator family transporter
MVRIIMKFDLLAAASAILLIALGVIQIIFGELLLKSVALTANGIDCIGDGFVSATVWAGLRVFQRPADDRFHFGYYKIENLSSIAAALVMLILAGYIGIRSYFEVLNPHPVQLPFVGIILALIAAIVALVLGVYKQRKGRHTNLGSVKLEAINTVKDGLASALTVVALLLSSAGFLLADGIVGFIIAGVIVSVGFIAIKESSYMLVDACDNDCILRGDLIREITKSIDEIEDAHLLRLRRTGPVLQGELEIIVHKDMTMEQLHHIRKRILGEVQEKIPEIQRLSIVANPKDVD